MCLALCLVLDNTFPDSVVGDAAPPLGRCTALSHWDYASEGEVNRSTVVTALYNYMNNNNYKDKVALFCRQTFMMVSCIALVYYPVFCFFLSAKRKDHLKTLSILKSVGLRVSCDKQTGNRNVRESKTFKLVGPARGKQNVGLVYTAAAWVNHK